MGQLDLDDFYVSVHSVYFSGQLHAGQIGEYVFTYVMVKKKWFGLLKIMYILISESLEPENRKHLEKN